MPASINFFLSYLLTPLLLGLHFLTQHGAFKFLFGAIVVIVLLLLLVVLTAIVGIERICPKDQVYKMRASLASNYKITPLKTGVSVVYQIAALTYLLYQEWYVLASVYIVSCCLGWAVYAIAKYYKTHAQYDDVDFREIS